MRFNLFVFLLLLFSFYYKGAAQLCEGNKGLNIFTEGDFGAGTAAVLPTDPMIAPGYNYTTQLPDDGQYSIINNTGFWNLYPSWIPISDNSPNPNGYMMVVNASFETGIFYEQEINDICGNTLYEFSADIINLIRLGTPDHIDPEVEFLIDGVPQFSTGRVPKNEQWNKYGFTFLTAPNTTSITLTLRNNAPGGFGNDLALDNISFQPCGASAFVGIDPANAVLLCIDDDPFQLTADIDGGTNNAVVQWQYSSDGLNWVNVGNIGDLQYTHNIFSIGNHFYRYLSAGDESTILNEKCRIISDVITIEVLPLEYMAQDSICEGTNYLFGNNELSMAGEYVDTFISSRGCDSVVYLDLQIIPDPDLAIIADVMDPSCNYLADGNLMISDVLNANFPITIFLNEDPIEFNQPINDLPAGSYTIRVVDRFFCNELTEVNLISPPEFNIRIPDSIMLQYGECRTITAASDQLIASITWSPANIFDTPFATEVMITPAISGMIEVVGVNIDGCIDTIISMVVLDGENSFTFPNAFSPNNDGVNDDLIFRPFGKSISNILAFTVYDRYGNIIFKNTNLPSTGDVVLWNNNNADFNPGVYIGVVEFITLNGQSVKEVFDITLLR